jgi:hypothetical protein
MSQYREPNEVLDDKLADLRSGIVWVLIFGLA